MKTKFFSVLALAGTIFLASCGGGVSEETKKSIAAVDSSWSAMSMSAQTWADELKKCTDDCGTCCSTADGIGATCPPEWKGKCDSAMMDCKAAHAEFTAMWKMWEESKGMWEQSSADWAAFKEKVNKGEIKDADAKKMVADFNTKLTEGNAKMSEWSTAFTATKDKCTKGMESWKNFETMMNDMKNKDPKKKM
jgi:hypothetical protein